MALLLSTAFRVLLWLLLTADFSGHNLLIGLVIALLLPQVRNPGEPLGPMLRALVRSVVAIPLAFVEAVMLIANPGAEQESWIERSASGSSAPLVIFLEVLAITLTPFTIVLGVRADGPAPRYRIHQLRPVRRSRGAAVEPVQPTQLL